MHAALKSVLGLAMVLGVVLAVGAAEDKDTKKETAKETTLKGTLGCPKCVFKIAKKCGNAIKVKESSGDVIYTLIDAGAKAPYHSKICTDTAEGSVKGTVSKKGKDSFIKPSKDGVKFD